ncbi:MAG TPA: class I SAM-dependent methyltransferase [Symbiobacteriaceae bacterium]|nr:class I SAM-dependent methyltransferase [Symbiobacteriaceae bacterium]
MDQPIKDAVRQQFGANAAAYVTSSIHAKGSDLALLPALAGLTGSEQVLDVATAAGHTALALAPHAAHVTGIDLTVEMLDQARAQAAAKGITNVTFQEGDAEALPFADATFDVVTCRIAAHHFPEVHRFCAEAYRVLKPGGRLVVIDNVVPEDADLDRFINEIDKLRDPSHVRAYRISEWEQLVQQAGFRPSVAHRFGIPLDREDWLARMSPAPEVAAEVRCRFAEANPAAREAFAIDATSFTYPKAIVVGTK